MNNTTLIRAAAAALADHYVYVTEPRWSDPHGRMRYEVRSVVHHGRLWSFDTEREAIRYGLKFGISKMRLAQRAAGLRCEVLRVILSTARFA